jgi:hypothetical protein
MLRDDAESGWPALIERRLPEVYLALALALTLTLCFATPPFFAPDESGHAARAISLGHGRVIERVDANGVGDSIDSGVAQAMDAMDSARMKWEQHAGFFLDRAYGPLTEATQQAQAGRRWSGVKVFQPFENTAVYPPLLYLPSIIGWRIGEAAHLTVFASLRLARVLDACAAVLLGWLALRSCCCSRWLLLALLLLPSTLYLNAICSPDALASSVAALAVAVLSRPLAGRRNFTAAELTALMVLLGLLGMSRPPYLAMLFVLFLPAVELRSRVREWTRPAIAFAAAAASAAMWWRLVAPLGVATNDLADIDLQREFLRAHPLAASMAVVRGTWEAGLDFFHRGLYVVGLNDLLPHHGAAAVLTICLALIVLLAGGPVVRTRRGAALLAVCVAAPLLAVSLAEYMIWTTPGWSTVFGIQPRYWLPVVPIGMVLLNLCLRWRGNVAGSVRAGGLLVVGAVMAATSCTLPWMVAHAFYREGLWAVLKLNAR